jgi:hypothetical protein
MALGLWIVAGVYAWLALAGAFAGALVPSPSAPRGSLSTPALGRHPVSARLCVSENKLLRLENALADLCAGLLQADDVGLLEQHAAGMGPVYMDGGFEMSRRPLMLRAVVRDVMARYELATRPVERKWLSGNHSAAVDGGVGEPLGGEFF